MVTMQAVNFHDGLKGNSAITTFTYTAVRNLIVYQEAGRFCGWPANHGIWVWGDEILVGYERVHYTLPNKSTRSGAICRVR